MLAEFFDRHQARCHFIIQFCLILAFRQLGVRCFGSVSYPSETAELYDVASSGFCAVAFWALYDLWRLEYYFHSNPKHSCIHDDPPPAC